MPTDVAAAEANPRLSEFYGFDPSLEYVIRSRSRKYNGVTLARYRFANGESVAAKMRADSTRQQKWDRGERLAWFKSNPGYSIYEKGTQPAPDLERLWAGQEIPEEEMLPDSGEEDPKWEAAAGRFDQYQNQPGESYEFDESDAGEAPIEPTRTVTSFRTPKGKAEPDPEPETEITVEA